MTGLNWKVMKNAQVLSKTNDLIIFLFFFLLFSLLWHFWSQLDRKYASFAFLAYVWLYRTKMELQDEIL